MDNPPMRYFYFSNHYREYSSLVKYFDDTHAKVWNLRMDPVERLFFRVPRDRYYKTTPRKAPGAGEEQKEADQVRKQVPRDRYYKTTPKEHGAGEERLFDKPPDAG